MTEAELLDKLTKSLYESSEAFGAGMPAVEREMMNRVMELVGELETSKGRLKVSVKNIRLIRRIREELNSVILTDKYRKKVDDLVEAVDSITELQTQYFDKINNGYTVGAVMLELKKATIEDIRTNLLDVGVNYNVSQKIADVLRTQITSGGKFSDLEKAIRQTMIGEKEGVLQRYAKTYANDSLYTYSAQYDQVFASDLGIEWYRWQGSIQDSSRPFCVAMNEVTGAAGCLQYIHVSQFDDLLKGHICDKTVDVSDKTGLPAGFKKNTTTANFVTNRGGWNCTHKLIPTPTVAVPKRIRDSIR